MIMTNNEVKLNADGFNQMLMKCSQYYGINPFLMGYFPVYANAPDAPMFFDAESVLNWFENADKAGLVWVVDLELHDIRPAVLDHMCESHTADGKFDNGIRAVWAASKHDNEINCYRGDNYGTTWLCTPAPFFPIQYAKAWGECKELWE